MKTRALVLAKSAPLAARLINVAHTYPRIRVPRLETAAISKARKREDLSSSAKAVFLVPHSDYYYKILLLFIANNAAVARLWLRC